MEKLDLMSFFSPYILTVIALFIKWSYAKIIVS